MAALTINQAGNGGVLVTSTGQGNVLAPNIINNGSGNVTIAAGTQLVAGDGSGGQVLTVAGSGVAMSNGGTLYVYSGNANGTGDLSLINANTSNLITAGPGSNTQFNSVYGNTISGGSANAQVLFRDVANSPFTLTVNNVTKTAGSNDPALTIASISDVNGLLLTEVSGIVKTKVGNNTFSANTGALLGALNLVRQSGESAGTYSYQSNGGASNGVRLGLTPTLSISTSTVVPFTPSTPSVVASSNKANSSSNSVFTTASVSEDIDDGNLDKNELAAKENYNCVPTIRENIELCFETSI